MHPIHSRSAHYRSTLLGTLLALLTAFPLSHLHAADALTWQQQEDFLQKAKITAAKEAKKGVTGTLRVTLSDGTVTHDASVQTLDESKPFFLSEVGFKDSYKFNVAAWKLAKLLGIEDMVPPSANRTYKGASASYTWWIDNVLMDEEERRAKGLKAPDEDSWNHENAVMKIFDQLIYNVDRNQTNILIDKSWHLWMIDHGRAFRIHAKLQNPNLVQTIDRGMLAKMKTLDEPTLTKEFGRLLNKAEIKGLLARRDLIVKMLEDKGESALFNRPQRN